MISRTWAFIAAIAVWAATILAAFLKGQKSANDKRDKEELEEYKETRERIDDAETFDDAGRAREFLRNRPK